MITRVIRLVIGRSVFAETVQDDCSAALVRFDVFGLSGACSHAQEASQRQSCSAQSVVVDHHYVTPGTRSAHSPARALISANRIRRFIPAFSIASP